ncbi:hypothetical protein TWF217_001244 [Orbilia oligospora]|nr:hypothetical protein TWF217_001244 [Orbilia oligospora]KAF3261218.1 hypothetical protein TWF128_003013 [Orbilia oligospora]
MNLPTAPSSICRTSSYIRGTIGSSITAPFRPPLQMILWGYSPKMNLISKLEHMASASVEPIPSRTGGLHSAVGTRICSFN